MIKYAVKVKRYLVFAGDTYYPSGGWRDLKGNFGSKREAIKFADNLVKSDAEPWQRGEWYLCEWSHVIDTEKGEGSGILVHEGKISP